jgi:single-strand DNA-binding protein
MSFNKITMVGNLGKDPELRELAGGGTVCNFNVAVSEAHRDSKQPATWFRITVWGDRAVMCAKSLKKGSAVYVAGRLKSRRWEDGSGEKHVSLEVKASDVRFFGLPGSKTVRVS